jgi:phosphoribosylanthranilate isomerase
MPTPKIKFCGLTDPGDAELAVAAGAWALGMILWPGSPRRCRPEVAAEIAAAHRRRVQLVGVFVNPTLEQVARAADEIGLTMIQLHGEEGPVFCGEVARRTGCRVIKAARVRSGADIQAIGAFHTDFHLLDSYVHGIHGGTGETFAWDLAHAHRRGVPLILSGGLNPANVAEAIDVVAPYAVDVASGVEIRPGRKDPEKLLAFAAAISSGAAMQPSPSSAPAEVARTAKPSPSSPPAEVARTAKPSPSSPPAEVARTAKPSPSSPPAEVARTAKPSP